MNQWGIYLLGAGLASIIFSFMNREVLFLGWINSWGESVAWMIRIALVVVGAAVMFFGRKKA